MGDTNINPIEIADDLANGEANSPAALLARNAILEARLAEAEARANMWEHNYAIASPKRYALIQRAEAAEARLEAVDAALDDASAPATVGSIDSDNIIERIRLWRFAQDNLVDMFEARLREAEQFARDIAHKLDMPYSPPVAKGDCAYLVALEELKERASAAVARGEGEGNER